LHTDQPNYNVSDLHDSVRFDRKVAAVEDQVSQLLKNLEDAIEDVLNVKEVRRLYKGNLQVKTFSFLLKLSPSSLILFIMAHLMQKHSHIVF